MEVIGRAGIEYREGTRSMFVDAEVLVAGNGIAVFADSMKGCNFPHDGERVSAEERKRILDNIRRAMEFRGQPVEVV